VSGVADIAVLGGKTKEVQAEIAGDNVGKVVQRFWGVLSHRSDWPEVCSPAPFDTE